MVSEGDHSTIHQIGNFTELNAAAGETYNYSIDWGDGSTPDTGVPGHLRFVPRGAGQDAIGDFDGDHVYADEGTYAVSVTVTNTKGISAVIFFNITVSDLPPVVSPIGLIFLAPTGSTVIDPQTVQVSNITSRVLTYAATFTGTGNWLDFNPKTASINPGATQTIVVSPNIKNLDPGVYSGSITLTFPDGSTQRIATLLVISNTIVAKTKSVCDSGKYSRWLCEPLPKPLPKNPPEPIAIFDWVMW